MRYILVILLVLSISSCYYNSEEYLFPATLSICDTTNVSLSGTVRPILNNYCYSCHSTTNAPVFGGNIKLEEYTDLKLRVDDGRLLGSIRHENGYSPMPKNGGILDDCSIRQISIWIDDGAPDN